MEHREIWQAVAWAIFIAAGILSVWTIQDSVRGAIRWLKDEGFL